MYIINFNDNTSITLDQYDSKWSTLPTTPIRSIEYQIGKRTIYVEGYHAYNHLVEWAIGVNVTFKKIVSLTLLVKNKEDVIKFIYNTSTNIFNIEHCLFGKEYRDKPTTGWKEGVENKLPLCIINER